MKNFFITATDTDAGKTFVACALTQALINSGKKVAVYKPIAAGCHHIGEQLVNEDAQLLSQFSNCNQSISDVNPIALEEAIAPHIAASNENRKISIAEISQGFSKVTSLKADINITEGAGGWRLPIYVNNNIDTGGEKHIFLSDFAQDTKQEVILVVNMKLGCLNHALLTYQAIIADGLQCVAWIANCATEQPMPCLNENITSLEQLLPIPQIAQLDFYHEQSMGLNDKINAAANKIDLSPLR
ncbi:dethiobiotin synthase [Candidatus Colwellia aromaticivorans]|uniref:dethiobiotin synthase n=1 Tax=Candidatus Colwellia aromaticivorans TaxID=2267621 RepID=UPI000DF13D03|nr:dethiobiotin synthase [Candidatus Colwellia aromaticivorans]